MITTLLNDAAMDRFQDMHHTTKLVKSEFFTFTKLGYGLDYSTKATLFLKQKLSNKPIRAYFVAKIGEMIMAEQKMLLKFKKEEERSKLLNAQLPFIFETIITIQYLHNQILDAKAGVVSRDRIAENLLSANLLKDQLYRYISQELPLWARVKVEKSVRNCFELVDFGQILEAKANRYYAFVQKNNYIEEVLSQSVLNKIDLQGLSIFIEKLKADLPIFLHQQLEVYFHRIYLTCAALFVEATSLIGGLLQMPDEKLKPLIQFSTSYGVMRQLVNDNADWVPGYLAVSTHEKSNGDSFSDLRNKTLTLPLIFFLANHKDGILHQFLTGSINWDAKLEQQVFRAMIESNALFQSIQNTRILGELALAYLSPNTIAANYLADSCEIVHFNKFIQPCIKHSAYKKYRKTHYCKQTKQLVKELKQQRVANQQTTEKSLFSFPTLGNMADISPLPISRLHHLLGLYLS